MKPQTLLVPMLLIVLGIATGLASADAQAADIALPAPSLTGEVSLEQALATRRSIRSFTEETLSLQQIGQLAWAAQGITDPSGKRTAPSAMALYPFHLYLATKDGVFRYVPDGHKLTKLSGNDVRADLSRQGSVRQAPLDFVLVADLAKAGARFGGRTERFVSIEAGHIAQNIHLQAVALGLGSVPVGGYSDDGVNKALGLAEHETPIYVIPVGHPKP